MLFNSLEFIYFFLPVALGLFFFAGVFRSLEFSRTLLLFFSLLFYGYWHAAHLLLILISLFFNYLMALLIYRFRRRSLFVAGVIANLGMLFYFKYANFFLGQLAPWLPVWASSIHVLLPLGISFYTFQKIACLADIYQGKAVPLRFDTYALFVTFFPQLIAGPITHQSETVPYLKSRRLLFFQEKNFFSGVVFFILGLAQKVLLADSVSGFVDRGYANTAALTGIEAWGVALAYGMQIYFDFSGYSNMACGLALMFNVRLPFNFNSPYQALSLIDFWRRWHITLSRFLRDYLYIPLGGSRFGQARQTLNLMVTMMLGGLWHGASWTFVVWGAYHGFFLTLNHWFSGKFRLHTGFSRSLTLGIVLLGWVFFRSPDFHTAVLMLKNLFGSNGFSMSHTFFMSKADLLQCLILTLVALWMPNVQWFAKKIKPNWIWTAVLGTLLFVNLLFLNRASVFLYWQF